MILSISNFKEVCHNAAEPIEVFKAFKNDDWFALHEKFVKVVLEENLINFLFVEKVKALVELFDERFNLINTLNINFIDLLRVYLEELNYPSKLRDPWLLYQPSKLNLTSGRLIFLVLVSQENAIYKTIIYN